MSNLIDRESAFCALMSLIVPLEEYHDFNQGVNNSCVAIMELPSTEPDNKLQKIADLVEGTIDHFDLDDAMDLLYQIKDILRGDNE